MKRSIVVALVIGMLAALMAVSVALATTILEQSNIPVGGAGPNYKCEVGKEGEWHFVINGYKDVAGFVAPTVVTATFTEDGGLHTYTADAAITNGPGSNETGYTISADATPGALSDHPGILSATLLDASAILTGTTGDKVKLLLSHTPCLSKFESTTVTELHKADHTPFGTNTSVPNSSSVHDSATVTGSGPTPTGTVTFQFFASGDCTGDVVSSSDVGLDGSGVAHPSQTAGTLGAGDYSFLATYSGDDVYKGSTADCEPFSVDRVVPTIEKTAETSYTHVCGWDIEKSADPISVDLFTGDSAEISYDVVVTAHCHDEDIQVAGDITIHNPSLVDSIDVSAVSDNLTDDLDCGDATIPATVGPGDDLVCSYTAGLEAKEDGTNVATATIDGADYPAEKEFTFGDPTTVVDGSVDVSDTFYGHLGTVTEADSPKTIPYTRTVSAPDDCGEVDNTASFVTDTTGVTDESSATVDVNCYELEVSKTAYTSLDRTWTWTIEKTGDITSAHLPPGGTTAVHYTVTLDATSEDSNWAVSGTITVHNPAPIDATINGVSDVLSDSTVATIGTCESDDESVDEFPFVLPAGGTLICSYTADLSDASERTNTATATLQNTPEGETNFSGDADVDFDSATINQIDECVDVSDDKAGALGTFCTTDGETHFEVKYSGTVGNLAQCTTREFPNTATFTTKDRGETGSDGHTVTVDTPCLGKTMGFWGNTNGQALIPSDFGYTLGLAGKCTIAVTKAKTATIFPNTSNGLSVSTGCGSRDAGINTNTLNVAFAQTLALRLNQQLVSGYAANTIGGLFCTSSIGVLGSLPAPYALSATSTIQQVLDTANYLIGNSASGGIIVTQTQLGALNALLGCMNREA